MTQTNEARIENCTLCNYKCVFCPHSTTFTRKKEIMSFELFSTIINKLPSQITDITISGFGEPFLDKGLLNKIRLARKKNYDVHVVTNGSLLTESIIDELLQLEVSDIRISFHSVNRSTYKNITGTNNKNYETVLHSIGYIWKNKGAKTQLIITADVVGSVDEEVSMLREVFDGKVDLLEVWKPHNWVDWGSYRDGERVKQTCGRPFNGPLQIQVDGTINMCCFDYNGELEIGDLKTQTLDEIYSSKMYNKIVSFHKGNKMDYLICNECDQLRDVGSIVYYNNKYKEEDRVGKLSTSYKKIKEGSD